MMALAHRWGTGRYVLIQATVLLFVFIVMAVFTTSGTFMLLFLAALQGIDDSVNEAAALDGATEWRKFRYITVPLLRPSIVAALAIGTVVALGIFDVIFVLLGTARDARSVMMQIYLTTFSNLEFGKGAALAVMLSLVSIVISCAYVVGVRRKSS